MKIENVAQELIEISTQFELLEKERQEKRDAMFGLLATQPNETYEFGGFRFRKNSPVNFVTFPKQKFIEALVNAGLSDEIRSKIISESMNESQRDSNLVVSKIS